MLIYVLQAYTASTCKQDAAAADVAMSALYMTLG